MPTGDPPPGAYTDDVTGRIMYPWAAGIDQNIGDVRPYEMLSRVRLAAEQVRLGNTTEARRLLREAADFCVIPPYELDPVMNLIWEAERAPIRGERVLAVMVDDVKPGIAVSGGRVILPGEKSIGQIKNEVEGYYLAKEVEDFAEKHGIVECLNLCLVRLLQQFQHQQYLKVGLANMDGEEFVLVTMPVRETPERVKEMFEGYRVDSRAFIPEDKVGLIRVSVASILKQEVL
jgi:hypothetical protein